jgi:hypothetical protein
MSLAALSTLVLLTLAVVYNCCRLQDTWMDR